MSSSISQQDLDLPTSNQLSDEWQDKLRAYFYENGTETPELFYHTMDLGDGEGTRDGAWDLRKTVDAYLGYIEFSGLRVLEFGPASGFLTFTMEDAGAEVVCVELPPGSAPDLLPVPEDAPHLPNRFAKGIRGFHKAWWYVHRKSNLKAKIIYGDIYDLPDDIGRYDVSTFCSILMHLSNPFAALRQAAKVTNKALVITEPFIEKLEDSGLAVMAPLPDADRAALVNWWQISSAACIRLCQRLGFTTTAVFTHSAPFNSRNHPGKVFEGKFFTVVAVRPEQTLPSKMPAQP